ncbi:Adenosine 5'-monophosphoramidase [Orbilia oligospora]|nr:Adenosine 5'-monophosphoramidase [Orbilia oligospora]
MLPVAKKLALAVGVKDFNILQNNGRIAHQEVDHVHVHMVKLQYTSNYFDVPALTILTKIPKPNETEGLSVGWPAQKTNMEELKAYYEELKSKM